DSGGDIAGKVTVGYQGWFDAANDGSGITPPWWHWTADRDTPTASNLSIKSWPDMKEYAKTYPTGFADLGGGGPATLYSDWDASTVDTQVKWMQDAGIDTIALQRFGDFRGTGEARNVVAAHVRDAALAHGRKFYVMYDITGWTTFQDDLKSDWTTHIVGELHLPSSPAYAKQDGKPVVAIWAIGYSGSPGTAETQLDVIDYFKGLGMYVIGGVGNDWRTADGTRWARAGFGPVFDALDAISPWMVGVIGDAAGSDANRKAYNEGDVAYLHARGKRYQPCVLPGDLQERQRHHGDFMWHQLFNMIEIGADGLYVSMYDEYNEGNQIAKTAATTADVPAGSGLLPLDEDGTACSSDYYLRLTGDGGKMLKKQTPLTSVRPTPTM
ncbi:MAG TPA: glycoside hydrolase family 71/99-like protein, partial [Polyangia bacterium]|nr:glycoside hydrolase family 71/99-like protein [Polyangia bacterium]